MHVYVCVCEHGFRCACLSVLHGTTFGTTFPSAQLTFALQPLSEQTPEEWAAVVEEGGDFVVVDAEFMGHVHTEAL